MARYLVDDNGFLMGQTEGQISPHGGVIFPIDSINKVPPGGAGNNEPKWNGTKWVMAINPIAQAARDKELEAQNRTKLEEVNSDGIQIYYLNHGGNIVPKNVSQLTHDLRNKKRLTYMGTRSGLLQNAKHYMNLALAENNTTLAASLKTYYNELIAMGPNIKNDTDMAALVYPTMPDIGTLDPLLGEDLLA